VNALNQPQSESFPNSPESNHQMPLTDKFGRTITDLRISVTDRCNFRCVYCRSADPENHMAGHELLRWDELERLARILIAQGIRKVRVTGGEPLVREGVEDFIAALKKMGVAIFPSPPTAICSPIASKDSWPQASIASTSASIPSIKRSSKKSPAQNPLAKSWRASKPRRTRVLNR